MQVFRGSFEHKKKGTDRIPGFGRGSLSELEIAQCTDWTPSDILDRGLRMLEFIEKRWDATLDDMNSKRRLLKLEFVKSANDPILCPSQFATTQ